jgi:hypothetical protein
MLLKLTPEKLAALRQETQDKLNQATAIIAKAQENKSRFEHLLGLMHQLETKQPHLEKLNGRTIQINGQLKTLYVRRTDLTNRLDGLKRTLAELSPETGFADILPTTNDLEPATLPPVVTIAQSKLYSANPYIALDVLELEAMRTYPDRALAPIFNTAVDALESEDYPTAKRAFNKITVNDDTVALGWLGRAATSEDLDVITSCLEEALKHMPTSEKILLAIQKLSPAGSGQDVVEELVDVEEEPDFHEIVELEDFGDFGATELSFELPEEGDFTSNYAIASTNGRKAPK